MELTHLVHSGAGAHLMRGALSELSCKMQLTMTYNRNGELYDLHSQWRQEQLWRYLIMGVVVAVADAKRYHTGAATVCCACASSGIRCHRIDDFGEWGQ